MMVSGKISEEVFRMYERSKCPFDLRFGIPPKPNELNMCFGVFVEERSLFSAFAYFVEGFVFKCSWRETHS